LDLPTERWITSGQIYCWYDLSWKEQRTVLRLAREGRRHPDPNVAKVAEEWAREKLGLDSRQGGAIASIVFGALLGDGASIGEGEWLHDDDDVRRPSADQGSVQV
jgi:hypothetical protein